MSLKCGPIYICVVIAFTGVECNNNELTQLYSKLMNAHNYLVPPNNTNIFVAVNLQLVNLLQMDTKNQEMSFTAILNLNWSDSTLSWNRKEFPHINRVTFPSDKIWTPNLLVFNSASDTSNNNQRSGDELFISSNGQVHWPIFGHFKTSCTVDVTYYYPFDQQVCVVKVGAIDRSIQMELYKNKNSIDLEGFYMSVIWNVIEAPAYLNVYRTPEDEFPNESDVSYYLVIRRRTHWLSEVCPLLAFAFMTVITAVVRRPMEKLILQVFCISGLFALHMNLMSKLPPTTLVNPLASKYIVALISCNLIHLTWTAIINGRRGCFQWIQKLTKWISRITERSDDEEGKKIQQDSELEENLTNRSDGQKATGGDKIVDIFNWVILALIMLAVVISTFYFVFAHPH